MVFQQDTGVGEAFITGTITHSGKNATDRKLNETIVLQSNAHTVVHKYVHSVVHTCVHSCAHIRTQLYTHTRRQTLSIPIQIFGDFFPAMTRRDAPRGYDVRS